MPWKQRLRSGPTLEVQQWGAQDPFTAACRWVPGCRRPLPLRERPGCAAPGPGEAVPGPGLTGAPPARRQRRGRAPCSGPAGRQRPRGFGGCQRAWGFRDPGAARPSRGPGQSLGFSFPPRSRCCVKKQNATALSTLYPTASKFECKPGDKLFFFFFSFLSFPLPYLYDCYYFRCPAKSSGGGSLPLPSLSHCDFAFVGCMG